MNILKEAAPCSSSAPLLDSGCDEHLDIQCDEQYKHGRKLLTNLQVVELQPQTVTAFLFLLIFMNPQREEIRNQSFVYLSRCQCLQ